ncbi:hypothetical protein HID58_024566 [Brassica napus]|uniref:Uncharacterized protein n=1 Tax=Brassica napus TaxID=3708 RepID=A0ABQ8CII9_BRANA|nr:hypothetical protein HID58_024566 [Brassica napus]
MWLYFVIELQKMRTAISWIPKGASKAMPDDAEPPSKEKINELIENGLLLKKRGVFSFSCIAYDDSIDVGVVRLQTYYSTSSRLSEVDENKLKLVSADQRERLTISLVERLDQSSDRIRQSRRTMMETKDLGQDLSQHRQTLLHSHSKLHGMDEEEVFKAISSPLPFIVLIVERKHQQQQQQTQTQLSEHKANVRNNKVNGSTTTDAEAALVVAKRPDSGDQEGSTEQNSFSGAVPAFDGRKNIYSYLEFQEDRFEFFANLPIPSCNTLIKCGDLREKLPQKKIDKLLRVNMRLVSNSPSLMGRHRKRKVQTWLLCLENTCMLLM